MDGLERGAARRDCSRGTRAWRRGLGWVPLPFWTVDAASGRRCKRERPAGGGLGEV
jgi:hypothetical protein